nr:hypothetical protein [Pseudomonas sp.]
MATIQNDRDLLLQAASVRIIPVLIDDIADALRGVEITAPSTVFKTSTSGATSPTSITLTAKLSLISGPVVWSVVSGSATLTGSGNTRTISGSSMTSGSVTVRATVTDGGTAYSDDFTIAKVQDGSTGSDGSDGSDGTRGTVMLFTTITGSWSDSTANALILSQTGSSLRVVGDLVTQSNNASGYASTRRWTGSSWVAVTHMFSGDVIVEKSLSASKIIGGAFSGETFTGGTFSGARFDGGVIGIGTGGNIIVNGGEGRRFYVNSSGYTYIDTLEIFGGTLGRNASFVTGLGSATLIGRNYGTHPNCVAIQGVMGWDNQGGASGQIGTIAGYAFYAAVGNYGPFTGAHDALIRKDALAEEGDIVEDVECVVRKSLSDTLFEVRRSDTANSKRAIGVVVKRMALFGHEPASLISGGEAIYSRDNPDVQVGSIPLLIPEYDELAGAFDLMTVNALGEGQINVCGQGGDIEAGDLIVCSDMPGKGMRQADDIVRGYTVAKAREAVTFSSPDEVKLVPCIYLCG